MKLIILATMGLLLSSSVFAESLYSSERYSALVSPRNVPRVGEIVTVLIQESSSARTSAGTNAQTSSGLIASLRGSFLNDNEDLQANIGSDFAGGGNINRTGQLVATMTVSIIDVSPSGLLHIEGEQLIRLNNEVQEIRLQGVVRPEDIADNNTVLSTRIGNANIEFVGKGLLTNAEKPGLITRVLKWIF